MPAGQIDTLLDLWAATLVKHHDNPPFAGHRDLYEVIDSTILGDVPWESFKVKYTGELPERDVPTWMNKGYDVWYRDPHLVAKNLAANPDFDGEFDYAPVCELLPDGSRQWKNMMSGDWVWDQVVSHTSISLTIAFEHCLLKPMYC